MKKLFALMLAVAMLLTLTACGASGDTAETTAAAAEGTTAAAAETAAAASGEKYVVGVCQLVPHDAPATQESVELFQRLHAIGFHTCLISNNKEPRVTPFAEAMETPYVYKADKPSRKGYQEGMRRMGTDLADTLFIGDQLFTDVWGANRTGLYSILVKPMNPKEEIQIVLKRYLEKIVLFFYLRGEGKK